LTTPGKGELIRSDEDYIAEKQLGRRLWNQPWIGSGITSDSSDTGNEERHRSSRSREAVAGKSQDRQTFPGSEDQIMAFPKLPGFPKSPMPKPSKGQLMLKAAGKKAVGSNLKQFTITGPKRKMKGFPQPF
jgi:hypothetical protein